MFNFGCYMEKLRSQNWSIPQNAANTAPLVLPELLALHTAGAAVRINADHAGDESIIILCTLCKACRQQFDLAHRRAIRNKICHNGILLLPLVLIDHLLPAEHHIHANLDLHSAGIVVHATAVLAAHPSPNDINERVNQPRDNSVTVWHTRHVHQWPR